MSYLKLVVEKLAPIFMGIAPYFLVQMFNFSNFKTAGNLCLLKRFCKIFVEARSEIGQFFYN